LIIYRIYLCIGRTFYTKKIEPKIRCDLYTGQIQTPVLLLTLWEPAYDIVVFRFWSKKWQFLVALTNALAPPPIVLESCSRAQTDRPVFQMALEKIFWLGVADFCEWRHNWSSFGIILAHVAWPRAQLLGQSVLLKFSLETRLESESFQPLIDFLAFLGQKLW